MLDEVTAFTFSDVTTGGRSSPYIVGCRRANGERIDLVLKYQSDCLFNSSLISEAIVAMLARDLDLPVPEPFLIRLDRAFIDSITLPDVKARLSRAIGYNFGSYHVGQGYSVAIDGMALPEPDIRITALEILAFDIFVNNPDRRVEKPNLLWNGRKFAMIDHEMALMNKVTIGFRPPWEQGGIPGFLRTHILYNSIVKLRSLPDTKRLEEKLSAVTNGQIKAYGQALPDSWVEDGESVDELLRYIVGLRSNASKSLENLRGALR